LTVQIESRNTINKKAEYAQLYEELGEKYPETEYAHNERFAGSRYWTVMRELQPYSRKSKRLVDLGCNDGVYSIPYSLQGGSSTGVDISVSLIRKASVRAKRVNSSCVFLAGEIDSPDLIRIIGDNFDVALFSEVLEHLQNPGQALQNIHSLLVQGGDLILTTPTPLFNGSKLSTKYVFDLLTRKRLTENFELDTTILRKFNVSSFIYRHDGYYPLALIEYVNRFGFRCMKNYTIDYLRAPEKSIESVSSDGEASFLSHDSSLKKRLIQNMRKLGLEIEIPIRNLPIINLLGSTNVAVFRKT